MMARRSSSRRRRQGCLKEGSFSCRLTDAGVNTSTAPAGAPTGVAYPSSKDQRRSSFAWPTSRASPAHSTSTPKGSSDTDALNLVSASGRGCFGSDCCRRTSCSSVRSAIEAFVCMSEGNELPPVRLQIRCKNDQDDSMKRRKPVLRKPARRVYEVEGQVPDTAERHSPGVARQALRSCWQCPSVRKSRLRAARIRPPHQRPGGEPLLDGDS